MTNTMYVDYNKLSFASAATCRMLGFIFASLAVLLSPWAFGSWEKWCFWPMVGVLSLSALFAGAGSLIGCAFSDKSDVARSSRGFRGELSVTIIVGAFLPFVLYALWRSQADITPVKIVEMESERSLMLFFTPLLLALSLYLSITPRRLRALYWLMIANCVALSIYGYVIYRYYEGNLVLWVPRPDDWSYRGRAAGPFFCPNHYAAYLNLGICMAFAMAVAVRTKWRSRATAGLALLLMLPGWIASGSRGGTGSLLLSLPFFVVFGLRGWSWRPRLAIGGGLVALIALMVVWVTCTDNPVHNRMVQHGVYKQFVAIREGKAKTTEKLDTPAKLMLDTIFNKTDRGVYISSAIRVWKTSPAFGVGPGQHVIRWPEKAATDDGDRETGKWPSQLNSDYTLFEVHSDWTQLLEEYGVVGMVLFLIPMGYVIARLYRAQTIATGHRHHRHWPAELKALPLAGILSCFVLFFHSFIDFSLQLPAVTWAFAAILALGVICGFKQREEKDGGND